MEECPCCGATSLGVDAPTAPLFAVCDVLVIKALETMGKWIVRAERSRFRTMGTKPWYVAHTLWQPDECVVDKVLKNAWDVVPAMLDTHGCCGATSRQVIDMLDQYVHDLVITGTPHTTIELGYRFRQYLGVPGEVAHA